MGLQSLVNGWINVNEQQIGEQQLSPEEIQQLQQQLRRQDGGQRRQGGTEELSAARVNPYRNTSGTNATVPNRPPSAQRRDRSHGSGQPSNFPLPLPGDGRVILERRRDSPQRDEGIDEASDGADRHSKWGPEPLPLSPEASPMLSATAPLHQLDGSNSSSASRRSGSAANSSSEPTSSQTSMGVGNDPYLGPRKSSAHTLDNSQLSHSMSTGISLLSSPYQLQGGRQNSRTPQFATARETAGGASAMDPQLTLPASGAATVTAPSVSSTNSGRLSITTTNSDVSVMEYSQSTQSSPSRGTGISRRGSERSEASASTSTNSDPGSAPKNVLPSPALGPLLEVVEGSDGSQSSGATPRKSKKVKNALTRTNSQSDMLKVMAYRPGTVNEQRTRRKSDAFLDRVRVMQAEQRKKLEEMQPDDSQQSQQESTQSQQREQHYQHQRHQDNQHYNEKLAEASASLSKADTSTTAAITNSASDSGAGNPGGYSFDLPQHSHSQGSETTSAVTNPKDDTSEESSIHKVVNKFLLLGVGRQSTGPLSAPSAGRSSAQSSQSQLSNDPRKVVSGVPSQIRPQHQPANTGQYLNEAAFVQHVQRQQAAAILRQQQGDSSVSSRGSKKSRSRRRRNTEGLPLHVETRISGSQQHHSVYPGPSQPPTLPSGQMMTINAVAQAQVQAQARAHAQARAQAQARPPDPGPYPNDAGQLLPPLIPGAGRSGIGVGQPSFPHNHSPVTPSSQTNLLEKQIMALQADMEYLRSVVVQNEFVCAECEGSRSFGGHVSPSPSVSSKSSSRKHKKRNGSSVLGLDRDKTHELEALGEASRRLSDVAGRHVRQVETTTKETARWQNDMHLTLSKLSMMCKTLNDESAKRKEEAVAVQTSLAKVRAERNSLVAEVEALKARIVLYENEDAKSQYLAQALHDSVPKGLDMADDAVNAREKAVKELSSRLQQTLDTLSVERQKEHRRLDQASAPRSPNAHETTASSFFNPFLGLNKEESLRSRCDDLQRQLVAAREQLHQMKSD